MRLSDTSYFAATEGDMKFYHDWAVNLASGIADPHESFYGLPGYAYLLAGIYAVTGVQVWVPLILQMVSEGLIAILILKIARLAWPADPTSIANSSSIWVWQDPGFLIGMLGGVAWAFCEPAQGFSIILMPTTYAVLTLWGAVWFYLKWKQGKFPDWAFGIVGLICGISAMMVATILSFIPVLAGMVLIRCGRDLKRSLVLIFLLGLGVTAGTSPCWIFNHFVAKEPVMLSSHSGLNFFIGNWKGANGYPRIPPQMEAGQEGLLKDSLRIAREETGKDLTRAEVSEFWSIRAKQDIAESPGRWIKLLGIKASNFWNQFEYDDLSMLSQMRMDYILTPGPRFGWLAFLALPGMVLVFWRSRNASVIPITVLSHLLAVLPVFVTERYRLAAIPGFLLLSAFFLYFVYTSLQPLFKKTSSLGQRMPYLEWFLIVILLGASGTLVFWPRNSPDLTTHTIYNIGTRALDNGNIELATEKLTVAYALAPDNSEVVFSMGNLHLMKNEYYEAKTFYRRCLEIRPRHVGAYNNLALIAEQENKLEIAQNFLDIALTLEPLNPNSLLLQYKILLRENRFEEATQIRGKIFQHIQNNESILEEIQRIDAISLPDTN